MSFKFTIGKSFILKAVKYIIFGLLLVLLFRPNAKAWLLQQFMAVGLFKAEMTTEEALTRISTDDVAFSFRDVKGNIRSTKSLEGKVVFVNFWATWCPPCRAEMPALNELYNKFKDDERLVFLFINEDNDPLKASAYLRSNGFEMPMVTSEGSLSPAIYRGTLPTTVVINKYGKMVYRHEGLAQYNTTTFVNQLKSLL